MSRTTILLPLFITLALSGPDPASAGPHKLLNLCTIHYPSDTTIGWECRTLKRGETAEKLFGDQWEAILRFNRVDRRHVYPGVSFKVPENISEIEGFTPLPDFYPDAAEEEKFILINLSEQFLGAYEYGYLTFSFPVASGERRNRTPTGDFRVTAFNRRHQSSLYKIEKTTIPYPMHYGLRFYISPYGVAYWIHGRDVPGYPASHGCVGLYDEEMQKRYYRHPVFPLLTDARKLYEWVVGELPDPGSFTPMKEGPRVRIIGEEQEWRKPDARRTRQD